MVKITHSDGPAAAASGDIVGLLRLKLVSERDDESTNRSTYRLKWSGTAGPMPTEMSIGGSRTHALFELRCGRSDVVQYINATPQRQALEVSCECESAAGSEGKATVFSGFVPLASLIERLSAADDANFQVADIPVVLKATARVAQQPAGQDEVDEVDEVDERRRRRDRRRPGGTEDLPVCDDRRFVR
jgi:hypothetical protein